MTPIRISPLAVALALALPLHATGAQNLNINGITIDTASGKSLGSLSSQGGMEEFTKLQKELVMTIIKQLGIDFQSLPPQVRGQIEKPQTTNPQALASFSKGLDLADKGQFQAAAAAFKEAVKNDPGFALASGMARLMPHVNLGKEPGAGGNAMKAMRQAAKSEGQQHAHNQLNRMNQANRNVNDLGVSDGRGKKDGDAKLDAINLVKEVEEPQTSKNDLGEGRTQIVVTNLTNASNEDVQRDNTTNSAAGSIANASFFGYASGIEYSCNYYGEGCGSYSYNNNVMASKNPQDVQGAFRNVEGQGVLVDVAINIDGDMLDGTASPKARLLLISNCNEYTNYCSSDINGNYNYSYHDGDNYYYSYKYDSVTQKWEEVVNYDYYYYYYNSQFEYSSWGAWWTEDYNSNNNGYNYQYGFWVAGELTPAAQIPNSGTVNYTGGMIGYTQTGQYLEGTMNWMVNFGTRNVSGSFDDITKNGASWLPTVNVNGGWSAGQNAVSATLTGTNVASGAAYGSFFGPNAEELGGSWRINHSNGDKGTGIFLGKPGGTRFNLGD